MYNLKEKLSYEEILKEYHKGCKQEQNIGIEYERLPIHSKTKEAVSYYGIMGVCDLLKEFAEIDNWDYILDNNEIIGLKKLHTAITLEPGAQFELSVAPEKSVKELKSKIDKINSKLEPLLDKYGITLLNYGVSPVSTYKNIQIIPKQRYKLMADYLWGILSDVMMRETAGIQVGIDFESEEDAMRKLFITNVISPFMTSMFANSSTRGGVDTGYKSFRGLAWLNTDNERCGFGSDLRQGLGFDNYVESVINSPMIMINRNNSSIYFEGKLSFKEFMKYGYNGYEATLEDFKLHENLFFPEVRLREYLEIRNHDCVDERFMYAIPAIYKGILYNDNAMDEIESLFKTITSTEIKEFRYSIPRGGLNTTINHKNAKDIAVEIQNIAYQSLTSKKDFDSEYMLPIMELTKQGLSPCDLK